MSCLCLTCLQTDSLYKGLSFITSFFESLLTSPFSEPELENTKMSDNTVLKSLDCNHGVICVLPVFVSHQCQLMCLALCFSWVWVSYRPVYFNYKSECKVHGFDFEWEGKKWYKNCRLSVCTPCHKCHPPQTPKKSDKLCHMPVLSVRNSRSDNTW